MLYASNHATTESFCLHYISLLSLDAQVFPALRAFEGIRIWTEWFAFSATMAKRSRL